MTIVLVRHGEATQDTVKGLSPKGVLKTKEVASHLHLKFDQIWHSPKERARQTAELIAATDSHHPPLIIREELLPDYPPEVIYHEINATRGVICLVSHLPLIDALASLLLFGHTHDSCLTFGCSTIVSLTPFGEKWHIQRVLRPQ